LFGSSGTTGSLILGAAAATATFLLCPPLAPEAAALVELGYESGVTYAASLFNATVGGGTAGFAIGQTAHEISEFVDCIPGRGNALNGLRFDLEYYAASNATGVPRPQPGPTPDMIQWNSFSLK